MNERKGRKHNGKSKTQTFSRKLPLRFLLPLTMFAYYQALNNRLVKSLINLFSVARTGIYDTLCLPYQPGNIPPPDCGSSRNGNILHGVVFRLRGDHNQGNSFPLQGASGFAGRFIFLRIRCVIFASLGRHLRIIIPRSNKFIIQ